MQVVYRLILFTFVEFLMKCHLVHNSTGVCILKNKTLVNIKNPTSPGAPLGLSHFQTDIINLSVEVNHACMYPIVLR